MRKAIGAFAILILLSAGGLFFYVRNINEYQRDGELRLPGLTAPVKVVRDAWGVPYLFAANLPDLLRAQGFVTAQDRLVQLSGVRRMIGGRMAELAGEGALAADIRMRVAGLARNSRQHAERLSPEARAFLEPYAAGVNAYVTEHRGDHPAELRFIGGLDEPWTVADVLGVIHLVSLTHSHNLSDELLSQQLIDALGRERAAELLPLNVNADLQSLARLDLHPEALLAGLQAGSPRGIGSNSWAVAPAKSASGAAILASDPHLNASDLPGPWHPIGLFCPEVRALGLAMTGVPGILIGRTERVALGITNGYGDVQDVYIETVDPSRPDHYLDGDAWVRFETREELIRVRDAASENGFREERITVRSTRRGPVISDRELGGQGDKVLTVRWMGSDPRAWGPELGIDGILLARNVREADAAAQAIDLMMFNYLFADVDGNIGLRATGKIPRRASGHGSYPQPATPEHDWIGWIPKDELPGKYNPADQWVGAANHDTRPAGYPYVYSEHFAPSYRYRRISELLRRPGKTSAEDHWQYIRDVKNLQAAHTVPRVLGVLARFPELADLHAVLADWDYHDRAEDAAPLLYQSLYRHLARQVFEDELGDELATRYLDARYYWQERFDSMLADTSSHWYDDVRTEPTEGFSDMVQRAAELARQELSDRFGPDPVGWRWGDAHTLEFKSQIFSSGAARNLFSSGVLPMPGSGATLFRANYKISEPYRVNYFDSARVVVDLADSEKILAVVSGGVASRHFHESFDNMVEPWVSGQPVYWWFSEQAVNRNARHTLILRP
jgi:penicillin amidase